MARKKGSLPASMASKPLGSMAWTYHFSPTSAPSLMLQSLPLLVLAPMQKILRWCIFLNMWSFAIHALHPSVNFVHDVRYVCKAFPNPGLPVFPYKTDTFFYWYQRSWRFCFPSV